MAKLNKSTSNWEKSQYWYNIGIANVDKQGTIIKFAPMEHHYIALDSRIEGIETMSLPGETTEGQALKRRTGKLEKALADKVMRLKPGESWYIVLGDVPDFMKGNFPYEHEDCSLKWAIRYRRAGANIVEEFEDDDYVFE